MEIINFYPRSPCGERLNAHLYYHSRGLFLSTLSLRRATVCQLLLNRLFVYFYPRSPCGERLFLALRIFSSSLFLSTLSLRRATTIHIPTCQYFFNFYPRSPCGERPHPIGVFVRVVKISIHALLAESDKADSATQWTAT